MRRVSRSLGAALPVDLLTRLSQRDLPSRLGIALPFITVDQAGRPHVMLASYLEVRAYDPKTWALVIDSASGTARNLTARGVGTLVTVEPGSVMYVKSRLVDGPLDVAGDTTDRLGYFLLSVDDVLEDSAADWETGVQITSGIQYRPIPSLDAAWAQAILATLATPRARV
jgi:hypothetical protein